MTDIAPARTQIQVEGTQFRSAVSEFILQSVGAGINFINERQYTEKHIMINGSYNISTSFPFLGVDGLVFFQYDAEIIDVWMFVTLPGSSGTTELDLQRATTPGGSFSSIFSTTPKITSSVSAFTWIHVGSSVPGTTAPVLSTTLVNAGDALRMDLLQAPTGPVQNTGLAVHYRPR